LGLALSFLNQFACSLISFRKEIKNFWNLWGVKVSWSSEDNEWVSEWVREYVRAKKTDQGGDKKLQRAWKTSLTCQQKGIKILNKNKNMH